MKIWSRRGERRSTVGLLTGHWQVLKVLTGHWQVLKEDTVVYQLTNCEANHSVRIANISSENVAMFKYLGVALTDQNCTFDKIKST